MTELFKCPLSTCSFTSNRYGIAGHIWGHKSKGEIPRDKKIHAIRVSDSSKPPPPPPPIPISTEEVTSIAVAEALLEKVVDAITRIESVKEQLKVARARIITLEADVTRAEEERDRILKIHNEQIKRGELTTPDELIRLARTPKIR